MKISTAGRHVREGTKSIVRNGWMTFASASAIAISLFILGVFLLLAMNVNHLANQIEEQVEIRVYLELDTPQDQIDLIQNEIGSIPEVSKVTFVSKDEGLKDLRKRLGKDGEDLLQGFEGKQNPLYDSYTVEVKEPREIGVAAGRINEINLAKDPQPIYKISYGKGTVETMFKITRAIRNVGIVLVIGLAFTAMFLIANTIKLTILARRREIGIMKLVGATNSFIRWPFFIEGALLGLIGSIIPVSILMYAYSKLLHSSFQLGSLMQLLPFDQVFMTVSGLLLAIGLVIGIWGSLISVRKYLKV